MSTKTKTDLPPAKFSKTSWAKTKQLLGFLSPYRWYFITGLIFLGIGSVVFMIFPIAAGELVNIAAGKPQYGYSLEQLGLILAGVLVVQAGASYLRVWLFTHISERGLADIRKTLFEKLLNQSIPYLEQHRVGELTSRSTADIQQLQDAISITLAEFIRQLIILVGGLVVIVWTAPYLALLMVVTLPVVILAAIFFGRHIRKLSKHRQDELAKTNIILEETLQTVTVVKAFNNETYEMNRYETAIDHVVDISMRFARVRGLFIVFIITVLFGVMFFVLWSGAKMQIPAGDLVTFITITAVVGGAIASLGDFYTQLLRAMGASERIMDILDEPSEAATQSETAKTQNIPQIPENSARIVPNIRFEKVHFAYPARKEMEILKGIDLDIRAGQKIALVGASGAGKTTITQLLLRFYQHTSGQILLDGHPIESYPLDFLRQHMAIVPQDVQLFGGTILENIRYGKQTATETELIDACKQANAWEFIQSFPEGLNTLVGERGVKLSGGQRQRIAIARAILKNPELLLLDEATSALDAESEKAVQAGLENLLKGRTAIIIAHRLATIKTVDCIYVLQNGQIAEKGSHEDLVHIPNGIYQQLASLQFAHSA